ncbi:serine/threonine-protein kinase [Myxococcota bacterium]
MLALPDSISEGAVIGNRFEVERVLGRGGMGIVVGVFDRQRGQPVALKLLSADVIDQPEAVERFQREARASQCIDSEHIAKVLEAGTLDNGHPYLVMEYLDGTDLDTRLAESGPLPVDEAVGYVLQVLVALAEAHAAGFVHRDLKPANLFVIRQADNQTQVKVLDFGVAKMVADVRGTREITGPSGALGSPCYMSPEQIRSPRDVDDRTDIWAVGVILYQLVTGRLPFEGRTLYQLMIAVSTQQPRPMRESVPGVPEQLEAVVARCLEKEPERRFANVSELAEELVRLTSASNAHDCAARTAQVLVGSKSFPRLREIQLPSIRPGAFGASPQSQRGVPSRKRGRRTVYGVVAGALLIVGLLYWVKKSNRSAPEPDSSGSSENGQPP